MRRVIWSFPAWLVVAFTVLQQNLLLVGVLGGSFVALIVLLLLPKWQAERPNLTPKERFDVENEARKTIAQIVAGSAVLVGLYFTWGTLDLNREGQITDRFTKAISQLGEAGPEKLAMRLGGIYALERIARDSKKDHWSIMEVLTAYVRETAPWPPKEAQPSKGNQFPREEPPTTQEQPPAKPATDIQAILTVLGRRTHTYGNGETLRLHLVRTDLRGASLWEAKLQGARFWGAQLQGADLTGVQLQGADLTGAQLQAVSLLGAQLRGAKLRGARLEWAEFWGAQLQEADLTGAHLNGAKNLTVEQLSTVKTLHRAHIDSPFLEQIQQLYPQLLEEPREGE